MRHGGLTHFEPYLTYRTNQDMPMNEYFYLKKPIMSTGDCLPRNKIKCVQLFKECQQHYVCAGKVVMNHLSDVCS